MGDAVRAAALQLSRRRAKQALGAIRKATQLLAQLDDGYDGYGVVHVEGERDLENAVVLARAALSERGRVEVVLLVGTGTPKAPNGGEGRAEP